MTYQAEYRIRNETSGDIRYSFLWTTYDDTTRYSGAIPEGEDVFILRENRTGIRNNWFDNAVDSLFINGDSPVRVYDEEDLFESKDSTDELVVYTLVITDSLLAAHAIWAAENPTEFYDTGNSTSGGGGGGGGFGD